jgi:hypothetical protein
MLLRGAFMTKNADGMLVKMVVPYVDYYSEHAKNQENKRIAEEAGPVNTYYVSPSEIKARFGV